MMERIEPSKGFSAQRNHWVVTIIKGSVRVNSLELDNLVSDNHSTDAMLFHSSSCLYPKTRQGYLICHVLP